jgi:glutathione-specific gamma-glutamylcyclotransferase
LSTEQHFIFAYGSLMWNPGFTFETVQHARLVGFHRRLSVYSNHYRGTVAKPGLVLGLDRGGQCDGLVYCVAPSLWEETIAYVRARELVTEIYHEVILPVQVGNGTLHAITYVVDPTHEQFAPEKSLEETLQFIKQGCGISGACEDYVKNTVRHLREMGVHEESLERLNLVAKA